MRAAFFALLTTLVCGCASLQPMLAPPDDLEDYRAFRVAAAPGTRLNRAKRYVDKHPNGRFAAEVKAAFEEEEPIYFERSQSSREGIRRYLADLPDGPHAEAAFALLVAFGSTMQDAELRDLARKVRLDDSKLEAAAVQRRAVGEAILAAIGVFLDDDIYGIPRSEAPPNLRAVLVGRNSPTWGGIPAKREDDYFFLLPTRPDRESRLLTLDITVVEAGGVIVGGNVEGSDMLVRWAEADQIIRLDADAAEDRTEAQVFAMNRLEGALERRFPTAGCPDLRKEAELFHRACLGWEAIVLPGSKAGAKDAIILRGPRDRKTGGATQQPSSEPPK